MHATMFCACLGASISNAIVFHSNMIIKSTLSCLIAVQGVYDFKPTLDWMLLKNGLSPTQLTTRKMLFFDLSFDARLDFWPRNLCRLAVAKDYLSVYKPVR
jgi:hypothetical protein